MKNIEVDYGKPPKNGWSSMVCELYVENIAVSRRFWCGILGFEIAYQRPEENFVYLERHDGAQVMLYQSPETRMSKKEPDLGSQFLLQIFVGSLSPILSKIDENNWPLTSEPKTVWRRWGDRMGGKREIRLTDPDGHCLLIAEDIGEQLLQP